MLKRFFKSWVKTDREYIEKYLAQSISLYDLERRQKELRLRGFDT